VLVVVRGNGAGGGATRWIDVAHGGALLGLVGPIGGMSVLVYLLLHSPLLACHSLPLLFVYAYVFSRPPTLVVMLSCLLPVQAP